MSVNWSLTVNINQGPTSISFNVNNGTFSGGNGNNSQQISQQWTQWASKNNISSTNTTESNMQAFVNSEFNGKGAVRCPSFMSETTRKRLMDNL